MSIDLLGLDELHSDEEREISSTVRRVLDDQVRPHIAQWYEDGRVPARDLAREFGKLGLLGMHLTGYGCAGASAVAYGLTCLELEAADSGVRSLVSQPPTLEELFLRHYDTGGAEGHRGRSDTTVPAR